MSAQEKTYNKLNSMTWYDKVIMTAAFFALCVLGVLGVLPYIKAEGYLAYGLASLAVGFVVYTMLSPLLKK